LVVRNRFLAKWRLREHLSASADYHRRREKLQKLFARKKRIALCPAAKIA